MLRVIMKETTTLALPILFTRLLSVSSNFFAMIMMAKLGTEALSASAFIMGIFSVCVLLVMSFSFPVCAVVAEASGNRNDSEIGKIITSSLILNTILTLPCMLIFFFISPILSSLHQPAPIAHLVSLYFQGMMWGYLPMIWSGVLEQLFIGLSKPKHMLYLSIISLILMPVLSMILMFGYIGFPKLGILGAGYAASITSIINLLYLIMIIIKKNWHTKYRLFYFKTQSRFIAMKKLSQLGWPVALQFTSELTAYLFITIMMGWVSVMALASHQIILQFTSMVVMIPMSISQATSVLVGFARGCKDEIRIKQYAHSALILVSIVMSLIACLYLLIPKSLIQIYLDVHQPHNAALVSLTIMLLSITALGQCFDGIKNVLAGAYRGIQETKFPMMIGTLSLWLISIPCAYYLGFVLSQGAIGIRIGFTIGVIAGTFLLIVGWYKNKSLKQIDELIVQEAEV